MEGTLLTRRGTLRSGADGPAEEMVPVFLSLKGYKLYLFPQGALEYSRSLLLQQCRVLPGERIRELLVFAPADDGSSSGEEERLLFQAASKADRDRWVASLMRCQEMSRPDQHEGSFSFAESRRSGIRSLMASMSRESLHRPRSLSASDSPSSNSEGASRPLSQGHMRALEVGGALTGSAAAQGDSAGDAEGEPHFLESLAEEEEPLELLQDEEDLSLSLSGMREGQGSCSFRDVLSLTSPPSIQPQDSLEEEEERGGADDQAWTSPGGAGATKLFTPRRALMEEGGEGEGDGNGSNENTSDEGSAGSGRRSARMLRRSQGSKGSLENVRWSQDGRGSPLLLPLPPTPPPPLSPPDAESAERGVEECVLQQQQQHSSSNSATLVSAGPLRPLPPPPTMSVDGRGGVGGGTGSSSNSSREGTPPANMSPVAANGRDRSTSVPPMLLSAHSAALGGPKGGFMLGAGVRRSPRTFASPAAAASPPPLPARQKGPAERSSSASISPMQEVLDEIDRVSLELKSSHKRGRGHSLVLTRGSSGGAVTGPGEGSSTTTASSSSSSSSGRPGSVHY